MMISLMVFVGVINILLVIMIILSVMHYSSASISTGSSIIVFISAVPRGVVSAMIASFVVMTSVILMAILIIYVSTAPTMISPTHSSTLIVVFMKMPTSE